MARHLSDVALSINKDKGKGTLFRVPEVDFATERLTTGILSVDQALGGGMPMGLVAELYGMPQGGKTSLCMSLLAKAQKEERNAVYIDAENAMNEELASKSGVDMDTLYLSQPSTGEEALDIMRDLLEADDLSVIVVDSVASLVPERVLKGDFTDSHVGIQARMLSQGLSMLTGLIKAKKKAHPDDMIPAIIFINQLRAKIGGMAFGPQTTTPGGMALPFYSSVRLEVTKIETLKRTGEDPFGHRVRVKAVKNKTARPFATAEYDVIYDGTPGTSNASCLVDMGLVGGQVVKNGSWFLTREGEKLGQGRGAAIEYIAAHPELQASITEELTNG